MKKLLWCAAGTCALLTCFAQPATAAEAPPNYGACVSTNAVNPKTDMTGPMSLTAYTASNTKGGTFWTAILASDGAAKFHAVALCDW